MTVNDCTQAFAQPTGEHLIDVIHPGTGLSWCGGKTLDQIRQQYPGAEVVDITEWCVAKGARQDTPVTWAEITEEQYWEWLECLPPAIQLRFGFLVGEPADHHAATGSPRFQACIEKAGKFFASSRPMTRKEFTTFYKNL